MRLYRDGLLGASAQTDRIEDWSHIAIGHSIGNLGHVLLRLFGVPEKEITEVRAITTGLVIFVILLPIIAVLAIMT